MAAHLKAGAAMTMSVSMQSLHESMTISVALTSPNPLHSMSVQYSCHGHTAVDHQTCIVNLEPPLQPVSRQYNWRGMDTHESITTWHARVNGAPCFRSVTSSSVGAPQH